MCSLPTDARQLQRAVANPERVVARSISSPETGRFRLSREACRSRQRGGISQVDR